MDKRLTEDPADSIYQLPDREAVAVEASVVDAVETVVVVEASAVAAEASVEIVVVVEASAVDVEASVETVVVAEAEAASEAAVASRPTQQQKERFKHTKERKPRSERTVSAREGE